ncbi:MAG: sensor histidine kinase [Lachnospiraceae bacterium]
MSEYLNELHQSFTLSKIFHEIKNPLTLISCSLQLIESDHPEVKDFRFWNQTLEDLKNLRILLDDMSSMQNGEKLTVTPIHLSDFLEDLLCSMEAYLLDHAIDLEIENSAGNLLFSADETKLRQVLVNLLKNAAEASEEDSRIRLSFEKCDSALLISVIDQGCGMSEDTLKQIFEAFHTTKKTGTGLGLPICRRIVEAHGGTISVRSEEGCGSTFRIQIPLKKELV